MQELNALAAKVWQRVASGEAYLTEPVKKTKPKPKPQPQPQLPLLPLLLLIAIAREI